MKIVVIIAVGMIIIPLFVLAGIKTCEAIEEDYKRDVKVKCFLDTSAKLIIIKMMNLVSLLISFSRFLMSPRTLDDWVSV